MTHMDLTTRVGSGLTLSSPFWIASSHHSENVAAFRAWREFEPAAITLKTCTKIDRREQKRSIRERTQPFLPRYGRAYYWDGPKSKELKNYEEASELLAEAKRILVNSKVGISVLATDQEDFAELRSRCAQADFWELNLKYSMRSKTRAESFFDGSKANWAEAMEQIEKFLVAFPAVPVFIKLPRELEWLPETQEAAEFLDRLKDHGKAGIVVANSRKLDIARFIYQGEETVLEGGVIAGDPLYDSTLTMIAGISEDCSSRDIPIVASGGMVDEQQILMAMRAGADAVQLCTAFDYNGPAFYQTLVAGLRGRMKWRGFADMVRYVEELRKEAIASVFGMPFMYFPTFWSEEFQKQIQQDIRFSRRMDFVLTSGRSLFKAWAGPLTERVRSRLHSIRALLLNPDSQAFAVVQQSWGLAEPNEIRARRERVRAAKLWLEELFRDGTAALTEHLKKLDAEYGETGQRRLSETLMAALRAGSSTDLLLLIKRENDQRKREDAERLPCPEWATLFYDRCPFYSMYIFDDKAYVAMYPFIRPSKLASPVYVYTRSSEEYARLDREFKMLWYYSGQTLSDPEQIAPGVAWSEAVQPPEE